MIMIDETTAEELLQYCRSRLPEEACGALIGTTNPNDAEDIHITGMIPITNRSQEPSSSFVFDANEWVSAVMNSQRTESNSSLIGTFHSHPTADAQPSSMDLEHSWKQLPVHLIISMKKNQWAAFGHSQQTKSHSTANSGEWLIGLNIHISPRA